MTYNNLIELAVTSLTSIAVAVAAPNISSQMHVFQRRRTAGIVALRVYPHFEHAHLCPWTDADAEPRFGYAPFATQARIDSVALNALLPAHNAALGFRQRRRLRAAIEADNDNHALLTGDAFVWTFPATVEFDF